MFHTRAELAVRTLLASDVSASPAPSIRVSSACLSAVYPISAVALVASATVTLRVVIAILTLTHVAFEIVTIAITAAAQICITVVFGSAIVLTWEGVKRIAGHMRTLATFGLRVITAELIFIF